MEKSDSTNVSEENKAKLKREIISVLETIYDPEIPVDIWNLGLIYKLEIEKEGVVNIEMTLTAPGCPVAGDIQQEVKTKVENIPGINQANVTLVWRPLWNPNMITEKGKNALAALGIIF